MSAFVDSLVGLGSSFTRLRVIKLAASFKLFPDTRLHQLGTHCDPSSRFQPRFGEFGQVVHHSGKVDGWEPLGTSCYMNSEVRGCEV